MGCEYHLVNQSMCRATPTYRVHNLDLCALHYAVVTGRKPEEA